MMTWKLSTCQVACKIRDVANTENESVEEIARALFRLRGRRAPHPGMHDGPHGDAEALGPRGGGPGPHGHPPFGPPPWAGMGGGRAAGLAWIRMLDALAAAAEPLSVSALGEAIGVDQPRASRLVQQGVDRGVVRREADPDDARRTRIALTDEGRQFAGRMHGQRREQLDRALAGFTAQERSDLARLLTKLAENWR